MPGWNNPLPIRQNFRKVSLGDTTVVSGVVEKRVGRSRPPRGSLFITYRSGSP